jgi:hypothetical protein
VALPADVCKGKNTEIVRGFCRDLSLCPRGHTVLWDDVWYNVYCFKEPAHAERFMARFGGENLIRRAVAAATSGICGESRWLGPVIVDPSGLGCHRLIYALGEPFFRRLTGANAAPSASRIFREWRANAICRQEAA